MRRAVPFFCTEKRNQKACQGGRQTIHLHASVRLPPWIPLHTTGLGAWEKPNNPGAQLTPQRYGGNYEFYRLPQCWGRCRAQRGGRGPRPATAPGLVRRTTSNLFSLVAPLLDSFLLAETAPLLSLRDISPNGGISGIGEASPYCNPCARHRKQSGRISLPYEKQRRRRVALPSGDDSPTVWGKCRKATKGDGRSKRLARRSRD